MLTAIERGIWKVIGWLLVGCTILVVCEQIIMLVSEAIVNGLH